MYVVQPDQVVVVQQEGGRVQDQLRRGARQFVQALAGEVQSVRVSAGALDHGGLLAGHLANLQEQQSIQTKLTPSLPVYVYSNTKY